MSLGFGVAIRKGLKVGYVAFSRDFTHPADSRRFARYALRRGFSLENADPTRHYDLLVVSQAADLSVWSSYSGCPILYDFTDSYLAIPRTDVKGMFRGLAKFVAGQSRRLQLNHWGAIEAMCRRADAVVCVTEEQRRDIRQHCPTVHVILDQLDVYDKTKTDYAAGPVFNLVWEGYPENLRPFQLIKNALRRVDSRHPLALHLVTKPQVARYMGRYFMQPSADLVRGVLDRIHFHDWRESTVASDITACDMAVIPIDLRDPLTTGKPENKLQAFWRMGLPAVVSATPAHRRAMEKAGLPMACTTEDEWEATITKYIVDAEGRRQAALRGKAHSDQFAAEDLILRQWDAALESIL